MSGRAAVPGRAVMLAVVVTGLIMGLVGMHHLAITAGPSPMAIHAAAPEMPADQPESPPADGTHDSGPLHLCLAILTGWSSPRRRS